MSNSPLSKIRFPEQKSQEDKNAPPAERHLQSMKESAEVAQRPSKPDWHEAHVLETLKAKKRGARNKVLAVLAGIAGFAGVVAHSAKKTPSAYEVSHDETQPDITGLQKKGAHKHPSTTPHTSAKSHKSDASSKIEIHEEIPHKFFVIAEKLIGKGLNKPEKAGWAKAIVEQMARANIPLNTQNIMIALATIDNESGFHETGITHAPEKILDRKIEEFRKENPKVYDLMEGRVKALRAQALKFINDRKAYNLAHTGKAYFTEKDVNLAIDYAMKMYDSEVPDVVKALIPKESLNKYRPKTSGCMQINVKKATALAREVDGETFSEPEMRRRLYTREGGLHYGMLYLKKIIDAHSSYGAEGMSEDEVRYAFADYNMGVFTTRNAAVQANLRALGKDITVDGDLVSYDEHGNPLTAPSDTEEAVREVLEDAGEDISNLEVRYHLRLEKSAEFEDTRTYQLLNKIFRKQGLTKTNTIPSVKASGGFAKFGTKKITGAGYVEKSYGRYASLKNAAKTLTPEKSHKSHKASKAKYKKWKK